MTTTPVSLVAYVDGAWNGYDPLSPEVDYEADPADRGEIEGNTRRALDLMADCIEGRFVFAAHTGVYCRELSYEEPMLELYRKIVEQGGELAVHPHEELIGETTLVKSTRHMRKIILEKASQLGEAGVPATAYRGGYGAFARGLTPVLEEAGIRVELGASPGRENALWSASWKEAPPSAYYLCSEDPFHGDCGHAPSKVLEIPLGWDGVGNSLDDNYLWDEKADLDSMKRTWDKIVARYEQSGEVQTVHAVSHLFSMGHQTLRERWIKFLTYAQANGARVVTPSQARNEFDQMQSRRAAAEVART